MSKQSIIKPLIKARGSAIIVALLIMALVATIATAMAVQQQAQTERTTLVLNTDRTYLYTKAVETWAIRLLIQNYQEAKDSGRSDLNATAIDLLPQTFSDLSVGYGFQVSGKVQDLQGKFNLNNLTNEKYETNFVNLILAVDPDVDAKKAKAIATATHDWVSKPKKKKDSGATNNSLASDDDSDSQPTPANSKINSDYTSRHPPYRAAQALMASPSELRLVKGMTSGLYRRLQPFITALPGTTAINVNTASAPVIASLSSSIDLQTAMQIVQTRGDEPYSSMSDFLNDSTIQNANIQNGNLTMNSTYFLVTAKVSNSSEKMTLHAMIYRPLPISNSSANQTGNSGNNNGQKADSQPLASILWESRGQV